MLKWFYKQKNSRRIWITVAAWMFLYVGVTIAGIVGMISGTPLESLETEKQTPISTIMSLIMLSSLIPGIFFTVHAVKAYKADKEAILPRPLEEIYAEQQQLTETLQYIQSQTDLQTLFAETNSSNLDLKVIRNLSQTLRSTTRRMEELKKEEEQAKKIMETKKITEIEKADFNTEPESQPDICATDPNGKPSYLETMTAPETTTEASPAADEASPAPDPVPPSSSKPSSNIATEPTQACKATISPRSKIEIYEESQALIEELNLLELQIEEQEKIANADLSKYDEKKVHELNVRYHSITNRIEKLKEEVKKL